jgi:hypothetical protein
VAWRRDRRDGLLDLGVSRSIWPPRVSIWSSSILATSAWCSVNWPVRASARAACCRAVDPGQLGEHLGSRSPPVSASSMARPETPKMSVATVPSLIRASTRQLLQPLLVPGALLGQVGAQPGVVPQPAPPAVQERPPVVGRRLHHHPLDALADQLLGHSRIWLVVEPTCQTRVRRLPALVACGTRTHTIPGRLGDVDRGDRSQVCSWSSTSTCSPGGTASLLLYHGSQMGCPGARLGTETLTGVLVATVRDPAIGPRRQTAPRPPTTKGTPASAGNPTLFTPARRPPGTPRLKRKSPVQQRALRHQGEPSSGPGMPDSHPSWRPPAMAPACPGSVGPTGRH